MVNQILVHIGNTPLSLIGYCRSRNIQADMEMLEGLSLEDVYGEFSVFPVFSGK